MDTSTAVPQPPQSFEANVRDIINESVRIEVQQRLIAMAQHEAKRPSTLAACGRIREWISGPLGTSDLCHATLPSVLLTDLYTIIDAAEAK